jgi:hypothetical protein
MMMLEVVIMGWHLRSGEAIVGIYVHLSSGSQPMLTPTTIVHE